MYFFFFLIYDTLKAEGAVFLWPSVCFSTKKQETLCIKTDLCMKHPITFSFQEITHKGSSVVTRYRIKRHNFIEKIIQQSWGIRKKLKNHCFLKRFEPRHSAPVDCKFYMNIAFVFILSLQDDLILPYFFMVVIIMLCNINQGKYQNLESKSFFSID